MMIKIQVKPGARISLLNGPNESGLWKAQLKSPPVDGRANEELIALVAKHFHCKKAAVAIKSGISGRVKLVRIEGSE
jgi:uncharacterized protein (TIGR00251 family)